MGVFWCVFITTFSPTEFRVFEARVLHPKQHIFVLFVVKMRSPIDYPHAIDTSKTHTTQTSVGCQKSSKEKKNERTHGV